jgi:arylsulfatase
MPPLPALAAFAILGGVVAAAVAVLPLRRADVLAVVSAALLATLLLVFYLNVVALPEYGLLHPRSLALDLALALPVMGPVLWWAWRTLRTPAREPAGLRLALAGATAAACVAAVAPSWPRAVSTFLSPGKGPDLVVIALDAVRRDHLGIYGYPKPTSPSIDALAPDARVFESAFAASSWTRYAVPAILGAAHERGTRLSLPAALAERGYATACFSDNPLLEEGSRLSHGFHHVGVSYGAGFRFLQRVFEGTFVGEFVLRWPFLAYVWSDAALATKALGLLARSEGPVFLYVHFMDAHMPYKREAIDGRGWRARRVDSPRTGMRLTAAEAEDVVAHYDGGVRSADAQVARLLEGLRKRNRPYLVVITADHGESLGEGGRWGHGKDLGADVLGVPLVVLGQGVTPGRVPGTVGHLSIGPTLLRAAGEPCHGCLGSDLRTSVGGDSVSGGLPPDLVYRVADGYKLVLNLRSGERRLHALTDVAETDDLSERLPAQVKQLAEGLAAHRETAGLSPEDLERMRALGYLDATGGHAN